MISSLLYFDGLIYFCCFNPVIKAFLSLMEKNSLSTNLRLLTKARQVLVFPRRQRDAPPLIVDVREESHHPGVVRSQGITLQRGIFPYPLLLLIEDQQRLLKGLHKGHKVFFLLIGELEFKDQVKKLHRIL